MQYGFSRRQFMTLAGGAFAGVVSSGLGMAGGGRRRPNILLILADDLGWADTSFTGSRYYRTPNIERLAARGCFFPNSYSASPLCSPTRGSIMTGQSPARLGLTSPACHLPNEVFEAEVVRNAAPTVRQLGCTTVTRLGHQYYTLAQALRDVGYRTAHFGKWHLGHEPYSPLEHGFEIDIPHWPGPGPAGSFVAPWQFPEFKERTPGEHIEDRMGDEAVAFLEAHRDEPFYLNYWQFSVHAPFDAKPDLIEKYQDLLDPDDPQRSPTYAAMVQSLDDNIGKMLDALDRLGLTDNTVVIFISDNGGNMYDRVDGTTPTCNNPLRGGKATMYEGGIRVPALVVWPGVTEPGSVHEGLLQTEDLYPTIVEMVGARSAPDQACDGVSLVPALRGRASRREAVFSFFPHGPRVPDWLPPSVCVRQGDWKLIRVFHEADGQAHRYELYNLREDIGETRNLAAQYPERVRELDARIEAFLQDTEAVVPLPNPNFDPAAREKVSDWQTGANGEGRMEFNARLQALQFRALGPNAVLETVDALALPAGAYTLEIRAESLGQGRGSVRCFGSLEPGAEATVRVPLELVHDRKWQECSVALHSDTGIERIAVEPLGDSGTVQIEWIRLRDRAGELVKDWRFEPPPRPPLGPPQPVVGGWQAGRNGHAKSSLQDGHLHVITNGGDPMLMTAEPLAQPAGAYVLELRMRARASGGGLVFGRSEPSGYRVGSGTPFPVKHDGEWQEQRIELDFDHDLHELRIDPCTGNGELDIDWIRLRDRDGTLVREWLFEG